MIPPVLNLRYCLYRKYRRNIYNSSYQHKTQKKTTNGDTVSDVVFDDGKWEKENNTQEDCGNKDTEDTLHITQIPVSPCITTPFQ